MQALPYKAFKRTNEDYLPGYWAKCRALYSGGRKLLGDQRMLREVFPPHAFEREDIYQERCRRAYCIPYGGSIVDMIVAELFSERLVMQSEPEADEFYEDFYEDCSPPGGRKMSLNELLKQQVLTALLTRRAWTLLDFPRQDGDLPASVAEQEERGLLSAYACPVEPECVRDWEYGPDGELRWVLLAFQERRRPDLLADRKTIRETFVYYTPETCTRYVLEYPEDKPPQEEQIVEPESETPHSFGRVPVVVLELTEGLWAMGKLESIAAAHFNTRNMLSWAEYKSLLPVPVHFAGPVDVANPVTEDPDRALHQKVGQGHIMQLGERDRLEFVGPDAAPFNAAMQDLNTLRDEMHRVLHHMALSVDNSAAALQRSGESKQVDAAATAIVLRALGQIVADHAKDIYERIGVGRGDQEIEWTPLGMDEFNQQPVEALLSQAQIVDLISIPSAAFQQDFKVLLAKRIMGNEVGDDRIEEYRKELEGNITNEQFNAPALMAPAEPTEDDSEMGSDMKSDMPMQDEAPKPKPKGKGKRK